jgi:hypothetical protein
MDSTTPRPPPREEAGDRRLDTADGDERGLARHYGLAAHAGGRIESGMIVIRSLRFLAEKRCLVSTSGRSPGS